MFALRSRCGSAPQTCPSLGAISSWVGTFRLFSARYISIDCSLGTRVSASPAKNSVGVLTLDTSLIGELFQNSSTAASLRHGVPPNHVRRNDVLSVWPYNEIQFEMPAPDDASLNRSVIVTSLSTSVPPALHPVSTSRSRSTRPRAISESTPRSTSPAIWRK